MLKDVRVFKIHKSTEELQFTPSEVSRCSGTCGLVSSDRKYSACGNKGNTGRALLGLCPEVATGLSHCRPSVCCQVPPGGTRSPPGSCCAGRSGAMGTRTVGAVGEQMLGFLGSAQQENNWSTQNQKPKAEQSVTQHSWVVHLPNAPTLVLF